MSTTTIEQAARMSDMTAQVVVVEALEADARDDYPDPVVRHAERVARAAYVGALSVDDPPPNGGAAGTWEASRERLNHAWAVATARARAALFLHRAATWTPTQSDAPVITRDPDELSALREAMVGHPDLEALARGRIPEVSLVAISVIHAQLDDVEKSLVTETREEGVSWRRIGQLLGQPSRAVWEKHAAPEEPFLGDAEDDVEACAWQARAEACHDLSEPSDRDL